MHLKLTAFAAFLCLVLSITTGFREANVLFYGTRTGEEAYKSLVEGRLNPALSYYAHYRVMQSCDYGMVSFLALLAEPKDKEAQARHCLDLALAYTAHTPVDGVGWTVAAQAANLLGDREKTFDYLDHSWNATRNELHAVVPRVQLSESILDSLPPKLQEQHRQDLAMLVQTDSRIGAIAKRYVRDTKFRERITAIVETLPPKEQARFIGRVRQAASQ